ncbi:MAG: redoxin family protein [Chitinophagaceae bacterium]|nr:redoxin family protein [Chitinophagaceae bacterium]
MYRMLSYLLLPLFLCCLSVASFANEHKTLEIGSAAPDFNLKGVDGKMYSLASFKDAKVLVIVFTCNHCPTSQAYEDRIKKIVTDYKGKSVQLIAISPNSTEGLSLSELGYTDVSDTYEEMVYRAKDKNFNFPYLYDGDTQATSEKYGPVATPHVFIFDSERKLRYQGRIDDMEDPEKTPSVHDTRNAIEALLAGSDVAVKTTKVFGCSTKWKDKNDWVRKTDEEWAKRPVDLEMIDEAGIKELLKNNTDKVRLINIWATWCGPCVTEFPEFIKINRMYNARDFEFITISADKPDKKDKVLKFLKEKQAANKNYLFSSDNKYAMIEAVDPKWQGALPYTVLVEPGGKIVYAKQSIIDPLQMKKTIVENKYIGRVY